MDREGEQRKRRSRPRTVRVDTNLGGLLLYSPIRVFHFRLLGLWSVCGRRQRAFGWLLVT